ncbi:hypothetical protein AYX13_01743 [Cryptococcus neoformans]|nr:hypothetical protein AYX13_01743 [Cryptococcus neoformans var. grubii]
MPSESTKDWDKLLAWLEEKHAGFETSLSLRDVPGVVRGLVVTEPTKERSTLLHIPSSAMLNPLTMFAADAASRPPSKGPAHSIPRHLYPRPTHITSSTNSSKRIKTSSASPITISTANGESSSHYRQLDTTELLTLHLALSKDPQKRYFSDWQVYIETLPKEFRPWHPLTWVIKPEPGAKSPGTADWDWWNNLYEKHISLTLKAKIQDVKRRYEADAALVLDVLRKEEPFKTHSMSTILTQEDLLWAWLNVNTRSISIPLGLPGPSERMNHTLVPILDMINHSSDSSLNAPRVRQMSTPSPAPRSTRRTHRHTPSSDWNSQNLTGYSRNGLHLVPGKIDLRLIAPDREMQKEEEVLFEYGGHSNATLFAEYGFCEAPEGVDDDKWLRLKNGELDVGWIVDELWKEKVKNNGNEEDAAEKQKALEAIACWGQNTIHTCPGPPHPSHSLLMSLRVLHLPADSPKLPGIQRSYSTYISPSNELATISSLEDICQRVVKESDKRWKALKKLQKDIKVEGEREEGKRIVVEMLMGMCVEDKVIAGKILERIEAGEDLS